MLEAEKGDPWTQAVGRENRGGIELEHDAQMGPWLGVKISEVSK